MNQTDIPISFPPSEDGLPIQLPASQPFPPTISPLFSISPNNQSSHADDQLSLPDSAGASSGKEVGHIIQTTAEKRRKKNSWTEEEHRNFLRGLKFYRSRWKIIAEQSVKTKTPSQVASHAQKFFLRQNLPQHKRKRLSIHDITDPDVISEPQKQTQRLPAATPIGPPTPFSPQQPQHPMVPTAHTAAPVESQDIPMTSSAPVPGVFSQSMNAPQSNDLFDTYDWAASPEEPQDIPMTSFPPVSSVFSQSMNAHPFGDLFDWAAAPEQPQDISMTSFAPVPSVFSQSMNAHPFDDPFDWAAAPVQPQDIPMTSFAPVPSVFSQSMNAHPFDDPFDWAAAPEEPQYIQSFAPVPSVFSQSMNVHPDDDLLYAYKWEWIDNESLFFP